MGFWFNRSGQVTLEAVMVGMVLMVFFSLFMVYMYSRWVSVSALDRDYAAENYCKRISLVVSDVFNSGYAASWTGMVDANVYFGKNFLDINYGGGKGYCLHFAKLTQDDFSRQHGIYSFSNTKSGVRVE